MTNIAKETATAMHSMKNNPPKYMVPTCSKKIDPFFVSHKLGIHFVNSSSKYPSLLYSAMSLDTTFLYFDLFAKAMPYPGSVIGVWITCMLQSLSVAA